MNPKKYTIPYRRKREGKTNYKKRLRLLLSGKPRLVVRGFLKNISAQIIEYSSQGDKVLAASNGYELEAFGWKFSKGNVPAAYLTGLLIGKRATEKGIKDAILDAGLKNPTDGSRIYACFMGAIDAGMNIPHSKEVFPSKERIAGKDIAAYSNKLKANKTKYEKVFSGYIKKGLDPADMPRIFEEVKNKIKVKK